jgi:NAD(P)-dependent dehydrogenase (short-subunit alcohol dehydrogenase family)
MALPDPPAAGHPMLPPETFAGQVVAVTGGGTGLGKAMAVEFARAGAAVAVLSRKEEQRRRGVAAVEAAGGRAAHAACDVRDAAQITAAFDTIEAVLGPVAVLVNNAAGNFPVAAEDISPNGWRAVTQIVLDGTFLCSREFATRAKARGRGGAVLNIAATYAWTGGPGAAHSAAAKAGVVNLTQTLAVEWAAFGIRVNALAPGLFPHDDMAPHMRANRPGGYADVGSTIPAGRVGLLHELGWAATYLCSPYAAYVSGHTFVIDGANWLRRGLQMPVYQPVAAQIVGRAPKPDA